MGIRVSVVIPVKNGGKIFEKLLRRLLTEQKIKPYEVIVVDDGSRDNTVDIARKYGVKVFFTGGGRGANAGRNIGLREARGDIIAFTDADCIPAEDWIESIIGKLREKEVDGIAGSTFIANPEYFLSRYLERSFLTPSPKYGSEVVLRKDFNPLLVVATSNFAIKKLVSQKIGGFDEDFKWYGSDDMDFVYRMLKEGMTVLCTPKPVVYHFHRTSLKKALKRYFQYGQGFAVFSKKHPESSFTKKIKVGMLAMHSWLGLLLLIAILSIAYKFLAVLSLAMLLLTYLIPLSMYLCIKKVLTLEVLLYPFLDILLILSSTLGFLYESLRQKVILIF